MRDAGLQALIDAAEAAITRSSAPDTPARTTADRVFARCRATVGAQRGASGLRLPVCDWIDPALEQADASPRQAVADALGRIEDRLDWKRRASADPQDRIFWDGHANAMIVGPGGLEDRGDVWIGATVMAPHVTYADHDHPPEEVYLSLTPGEWWNERMDWTDPGMSGLIHNPPAIRHAMRSGDRPFLALWFLPV